MDPAQQKMMAFMGPLMFGAFSWAMPAGLSIYLALSTLLLLAPQTPLLFMGQEWGAGSPFQFFTDFDPELGRLVTEGRREEFKSFAAFANPEARERIPDPQASDTYLRSRLDWDELNDPSHDRLRGLYTRLLTLRRDSDVWRHPVREAYTVRALDGTTIAVDYDGGRLVVIARLGGAAARVSYPLSAAATAWLTTEDPEIADTPRPPAITHANGSIEVAFERPGAIVLRRMS